MCIFKKTGWAFKRWLDYLNAQSMFVESVWACLVTVACLVMCVLKKKGWAFKRWLDYLNAQFMFVEYV